MENGGSGNASGRAIAAALREYCKRDTYAMYAMYAI